MLRKKKPAPSELDAYSIDEFCARHCISRGKFYLLLNEGKAPKTFHVGSRVLISKESAASWRAEREGASS
jgi:predicted DNA-binding transcriptional regulator AlpA